MIQLDTELQAFDFVLENFLPNKFDVFGDICTASLDLLFAQKIAAICPC